MKSVLRLCTTVAFGRFTQLSSRRSRLAAHPDLVGTFVQWNHLVPALRPGGLGRDDRGVLGTDDRLRQLS
jgi:hypothetical protein